MQSEYPIEAMERDVSPLSTDDERSESNDIYMTPQAVNEGRKTQSLYSIAGMSNRRTPIVAASREIKELQSKLEQCRAEQLYTFHREREVRRMLPREVDSILDEFFKLQLESVNINEEMQKLTSSLKLVTSERDEALHHLIALQLKKQKDEEKLQSLVNGLTEKLDSATAEPKDFVDFSITSTVMDPDFIELQQKLTDVLEENMRLLDLNSKLQEELDARGSTSHQQQMSYEAAGRSTTKQATNTLALLTPTLYSYVSDTGTAEPCIFNQPGTSSSDAANRISVPFETSVQGSAGLFGCTTKPSRGNFGCIIS